MIIVVAAAIIDKNSNILIAQRKAPKEYKFLWEFPGGKVEKNEDPTTALKRELKEELDIDTDKTCFAPFSFTQTNIRHNNQERKAIILLYLLRKWQGIPKPLASLALKFISADDLIHAKMLAANKEMAAQLRDFLRA